jgi:dienelactone hydrolase
MLLGDLEIGIFGKRQEKHLNCLKKVIIMKIRYMLFAVAACVLCAGLFLYLNHAKYPPAVPVKGDVSIVTGDKVVLAGRFCPAAPGKLTFIMLHGLGSVKEEWNNFAAELEKEGYGYLLLDLRGHGGSCRYEDGREIRYNYFTATGRDSQWSRMPGDLAKAVKYLHRSMKIPVDRIGLMGASLGANICLVYSSGNKAIPLVAVLSPGWEYAGLGIKDAALAYGRRPAFVAASPQDRYAYESSRALFSILLKNGSPAVFEEGRESRHGVQMFDGIFDKNLIGWIRSIK